MKKYCVNTKPQDHGEHEVHSHDCALKPMNFKDLGYHLDCHSAVSLAIETYPRANGCRACCRDCYRVTFTYLK